MTTASQGLNDSLNSRELNQSELFNEVAQPWAIDPDMKTKHQQKLESLRKINALIEKPMNEEEGEDKQDVENFILSNIRKSFRAVQTSLEAHTQDINRAMPVTSTMIKDKVNSLVELYSEAVKLTNNLMDRLQDSSETDLIDINFQKITPNLLFVFVNLEPEENQFITPEEGAVERKKLMNEINKVIRKYLDITGNVDQIILALLATGIDHEDPYLRFKYVQMISHLIVRNFMKSIATSKSPQRLSELSSFNQLIRKLLLRAKTDKLESIQIECQNSLREIVRLLKQDPDELDKILEQLSHAHVQQLKKYADENLLVSQNTLPTALRAMRPPEQYSWSQNMAFGAIPFDLVDTIRQNSSDFIIKLRCITDLEHVLNDLDDFRSVHDLKMLQNYSGSFVQFIQEFLLQEEYEDLKILMIAIKAIRLVFKYPKDQVTVDLRKVLRSRINFHKLITALMRKMADPKEIVRNEITYLMIEISNFIDNKECLLLVIEVFESPRLSEVGKRSSIQLVIMLLLKWNDDLRVRQLQEQRDYEEIEMWGDDIMTQQFRFDSGFLKNPATQVAIENRSLMEGVDIDLATNQQNIYLRMVEPLAYLFQSKDQSAITRYLAQECLAVMCDSCMFLYKTLVLETMFETLIDHPNQKDIYNRFCDRLDAKQLPYLNYVRKQGQGNALKLELPLPQAYLFFYNEDEMTIEEQLQQLRGQNRDLTARSNEDYQDSVEALNRVNDAVRRDLDDQAFGSSLRSRALKNKQGMSRQNDSLSLPPLPGAKRARANYQSTPQMTKKLSLRERSMMLKQQPSEAYTQPSDLRHIGSSLHERIEQRRAEQKAFRLNNSQPEFQTLEAELNGPSYQDNHYSFQEPVQKWEAPKELTNRRQMTIAKPPKGKRLLPLSKQKKLDLGSLNPRDIPNFRDNPKVAPENFLLKPTYEEDRSASKISRGSRGSRGSRASHASREEKTPSPSLRKKRNVNVSDIVTKPEAEVYLTEEGPNKFAPLVDPGHQIRMAIKTGLADKSWQTQFDACNVIRNALRYHVYNLSKAQIAHIIEKLMDQMESLRSQIAKNAILALSDCFEFLSEGQISDQDISAAFSKLLKKGAETNHFLAEEARIALEKLCKFTHFDKSIRFLFPYYEEKSHITRRQISHCLVIMMDLIGAPNIEEIPKAQQVQLFQMISFFLFDPNPQVRINAQRAILTLEHGSTPFMTRQESVKLISQNIKNSYDLQKAVQILERGPVEERTIDRSASKYSTNSPNRKPVSILNTSVKYNDDQHSTGERSTIRKKPSTKQVTIAPSPPSKLKLRHKGSLDMPREQRVMILDQIATRLYTDREKKKEAMEQVLNICHKQKVKVLKEIQLERVVLNQILLPLQIHTRMYQEAQKTQAEQQSPTKIPPTPASAAKKTPLRSASTKSLSSIYKKPIPGRKVGGGLKGGDDQPDQAVLTTQLIEAKILSYLLPEFKLSQVAQKEEGLIRDTIEALCSFLSIYTKNQFAIQNAQECLHAIVRSLDISHLATGLYETMKRSETKVKVEILMIFINEVHRIKASRDQKTEGILTLLISEILDEFKEKKKKHKGKGIYMDLITMERQLVQEAYRVYGEDLSRQIAQVQLSTFFDIVSGTK